MKRKALLMCVSTCLGLFMGLTGCAEVAVKDSNVQVEIEDDTERVKIEEKDNEKDIEEDILGEPGDLTTTYAKVPISGVQFNGFNLDTDFLDKYEYYGSNGVCYIFANIESTLSSSDPSELVFLLASEIELNIDGLIERDSETSNDSMNKMLEVIQENLDVILMNSDLLSDVKYMSFYGDEYILLDRKVDGSTYNIALGKSGTDTYAMFIAMADSNSVGKEALCELLDSCTLNTLDESDSLNKYISDSEIGKHVFGEYGFFNGESEEPVEEEPVREEPVEEESVGEYVSKEDNKIKLSLNDRDIIVGQSNYNDIKDAVGIEPMITTNFDSGRKGVSFGVYGNPTTVEASFTPDDVVDFIAIEYGSDSDYAFIEGGKLVEGKKEPFIEFKEIPYQSTLETMIDKYGDNYEKKLEDVYLFNYSEFSNIKVFIDDDGKIWRIEANFKNSK